MAPVPFVSAPWCPGPYQGLPMTLHFSRQAPRNGWTVGSSCGAGSRCAQSAPRYWRSGSPMSLWTVDLVGVFGRGPSAIHPSRPGGAR
jgi:hypothetical protein